MAHWDRARQRWPK